MSQGRRRGLSKMYSENTINLYGLREQLVRLRRTYLHQFTGEVVRQCELIAGFSPQRLPTREYITPQCLDPVPWSYTGTSRPPYADRILQAIEQHRTKSYCKILRNWPTIRPGLFLPNRIPVAGFPQECEGAVAIDELEFLGASHCLPRFAFAIEVLIELKVGHCGRAFSSSSVMLFRCPSRQTFGRDRAGNIS